MSIPTNYARLVLENLAQGQVKKLIAQADARRILQEVKEAPENYPKFDSALTEKATYIAYTLISCGCSIIENDDTEPGEGLEILEKAGKILSDTFRFNSDAIETRNYNLLVAGMSLYAAKQYSRAFIILHDIDVDFAVGQIIVNFIKRDFKLMLEIANRVLFTRSVEQLDVRGYDEWVISHEIARCFLIIENFIHTGDQGGFIRIRDILEKLLVLSSLSELTLYWLIIRLLKIIISTFENASLWSVLPSLFSEKHTVERYIRWLSGFRPPITEMWPSQTASLPLATGDNPGAVINLRTSAGKTRVAEIAILRILSIHSRSKILYLAPFRSLAFEIEQNLNKILGALGITVSQLYGGSTVNVTDFELINESQVFIATPEKARALIRRGTGLKNKIKLIVVDEGHLLGAEERHIKNEIFLTHIKEYALRNQIRVLLLSAVLPNADDVAQWIAGDSSSVAKSEWKPALERLGLLFWDGNRVRLEWKSEEEPFNPNFIQKSPLGFGKRRNLFPNNKNEAIAATAVRLSWGGTVMIYSARANSINGLARDVLLALGEHPKNYPWDHSLWNVFENICKEELNDDGIVLSAAKKGIVCHSNRLPTLVRIAIERLMRSKPPLIIIASSTLGQGINVGISTIIISTPYYGKEVISNGDFWNICGRAGRAFSDVEGKILYSIDTTREQWQINKDKRLARDYFDNHQMEKVQSGLLAVLKYIFKIAVRAEVDFTLLVETIANDFIEDNIHEGFSRSLNNIFDFLDDGLLAMHEDFSADSDDVSWIDDVFRKSLALIQATNEDKKAYLDILKARTTALLYRIPNRADRKKIIATGIPLSVSEFMLEDINFFRDLALNFIQSTVVEHDYIESLDSIVREIEIWSNKKARNLMQLVPDQDVLDNIRRCWISGDSLATITNLEQGAGEISKNYYGFTLPWIMHAISQIFDQEQEGDVVQLYSLLAMFVEVGLPNVTAINIYMAGVRSRSAALELSSFEVFKNKSLPEVRQIFLKFPVQDSNLSDSSKAWLELLTKSVKAQAPREISFPHFIWREPNLPEELYLREVDGKYFLTSNDGYFYKKVRATDNLPFSHIANIPGLFFIYENGEWKLRSHNPRVVINDET